MRSRLKETLDVPAARDEGDADKTLTERAFRLIRDDIVAGRLAPGEKLRIDPLRKRYDIGASPLREALSRLSSDGMVETEGQRGFHVSPISLDALWDITETRLLLEGHALRRSIERGGDDWESAVVAAYHRLHRAEQRRRAAPEAGLDDWEDRNRDFHDALIGNCGQPWLLRLRRILYHQHERYRRLVLLKRPIPRDVEAEHKAIMDAALARDADTACRLSDAHILRTAEAIAEFVAKHPAGAAPEAEGAARRA
ncbi:MAG: FCD domain-containing protein [Zavarzinia sp.]|nr:FCD domain-containing protein [Zavarzinia sp.]